MNGSFEKRRGECGSVGGPPNLGGAASATSYHGAALSSLSAPCIAIFNASSGNGRCNAFASSHGARIQTSRSSSVIRITGIALRMDRLDDCGNLGQKRWRVSAADNSDHNRAGLPRGDLAVGRMLDAHDEPWIIVPVCDPLYVCLERPEQCRERAVPMSCTEHTR
jgi:hypothetical protein